MARLISVESTASQCLVAGASRGVGFEVVKGLRQQGYAVTAWIRTADARPQLMALGAEVHIGDALDAKAAVLALQSLGQAPFMVVTTVGGKGMERDLPRSDYLGNRHLVDATRELPCQRFLLVSSIGVGDSAIALPPAVLATLRPALLAKKKAEEYLCASPLPYTIVRPGSLVSDRGTGRGILSQDSHIAGPITRIDVASLIIQCLQSTRAENQILAAVDRDRLDPSQEFAPFQL